MEAGRRRGLGCMVLEGRMGMGKCMGFEWDGTGCAMSG
jgi:hypothetical protein